MPFIAIAYYLPNILNGDFCWRFPEFFPIVWNSKKLFCISMEEKRNNTMGITIDGFTFWKYIMIFLVLYYVENVGIIFLILFIFIIFCVNGNILSIHFWKLLKKKINIVYTTFFSKTIIFLFPTYPSKGPNGSVFNIKSRQIQFLRFRLVLYPNRLKYFWNFT